MTVPHQTSVWLTIAEAARILGCNERSVRRRIAEFETRQNANSRGGAGGISYEISLDSLPEEARAAWKAQEIATPLIPTESALLHGEAEEIAHAYQKLDRRGKAHFDKWSIILQESQHVTGRKALEQWTQEWNESHPESMCTSAPSIYRLREKVAKEGRRALLMPERKIAASTVTDEWFEWFREDFLKQSKLSAAMCRLLVLGRARTSGWIGADEEFPSIHAFLRRMGREVSPSLVDFAREGQKKWNDRNGYYIERDYESLPVGSCWVGDTHTWDVFVRKDGETVPSTVYITAFLDMRTYLPMGWHIHTSAPSTDNTLRAMKMGIDRYGVPDDVYVDNGREYRNRDFSGIVRSHRIDWDEQAAGSLAARLGFQMHFAIVKNAQAKIIERQFKGMKDSFSRFFSSYKGGSVVEKPERLKEVVKHPEQIPTLAEFTALADRFLKEILPAMPCHGAHHGGLSRVALWNRHIQERSPLRLVSKETSSMLVSRTAKGRIVRNGFYLRDLQCWYWAEWMAPRDRHEITLRYDPEDLSVAWGYDESMSLIESCQLVEVVGAVIREGDHIGKAAVVEGIARRRQKQKLVKALVPGANPRQAAEILDNLAAAVGAPQQIDTGDTLLQLTRHDHDAAQLKREALLGTGDFSRLDPDPSPPGKRALRWHEEEPIAAAI